MIVKISGKLVEKREGALIIDVKGLSYEVFVPASVMSRLNDAMDEYGMISLITYHYFQIGPSKGLPCLVGFLSEVEKDFFLEFIKVSGIGPRAAVKALNQSIADIAGAITRGDEKFLKNLPGIGAQKAKEIIAKLQNKVGKYGLIQDQHESSPEQVSKEMSDWQQGALDVLLQLQYKRPEAKKMIEQALERSPSIKTEEELLNAIYKQRISV